MNGDETDWPSLEAERLTRHRIREVMHAKWAARDVTSDDWLASEKRAALDEVNRLRARRKLPPIGMDAIDRAEGLASGHSDYALKCVLHYTDLALGRDPRA